MIYATVNMTVGDYESTCDQKIVLYRGDKNVEIRFVIKSNRFTVLDSTYAQLIITRPSSSSIFSEPAAIQNDTVVLVISEEMIDELNEIGEHTFQIRLYDDTMNARVTLPPCDGGIIINEPIAIEGESLINTAMINYSAVLASETDEETFDENNLYNKTEWMDGDIITDARMNKIENALWTNTNDILGLEENYATKDELEEAINGVDVTDQLQDYAKTNDIPTKTSQLTNDSGYLTSIPSEYVTDSELNNKGYATTDKIDTELNRFSEEIIHYITPEMFGAIGDGVTDDSTAIQTAIDTAGNTSPVYLSRKNYKISTGLFIRTNYSIFRCDGTITYDGTNSAITLTNTLRSEVNVNTIYAPNGTAVRLSNTEGRVTFNQISVNNIRSSKVGIHLTTPNTENAPIYYNKISYMDIIATEKGIHSEPIGYYINENRYYGGTIGGGCFYGIKLGNSNVAYSTGSNKFLSGGIEGIAEDGYGIYIENSEFNIFRNIRTLERYGKYVIGLKGLSSSNKIEIDKITLTEVDISELGNIGNGYNELRAMSMACDGGTLIAKEVRVSSLYGFSYDSRTSNRAYNVVTADMFENNVIQHIDTVKIPTSLRFENAELDGLTFTLGSVYTALTSMVRGLPLTLSFGSENGKIILLDEDGNTVIDNSNGYYAGQTVSVCWDGHSLYNSKNVWNITYQDGVFKAKEFKKLEDEVTELKTNLDNHINQIAGFLPEVPEEYRQVDYIQSDGGQYFNTGVLASNYPEGLKYVFDGTVMGYDTTASEYLWGAMANGRRSGYVNISDETMRFLVNIGNTSSSAAYVNMTIGERVMLELTATSENPLGMTFFKNGTEGNYFIVDNSTASPMPSADIYLLRMNGSSATRYAIARIYRFSIYKIDGTVLRNFIPCYRKADSVVGLYDTATATFFANSGTGELAKGADVFSPFEEGTIGDTGDNKIGYATCSTAADVAEKILTIADTNWKLEVGSTITVEHEASNTASNVTLNVNGTGAYPIWYNGSEYTSTSSTYAGHDTRPITYLFNGTHWIWLNIGYYPSIPTNPSLGHGYGTCTTAEATLAKTCTISSYTLSTGGSVSIKFTNAVPANSTLNIRTRGAKKIFYKGSAITDGVIKAGDTATFVYDGTQYQLISIDRDETVTKTSQLTNDSGYITSIPSEYVTDGELNAKNYVKTVNNQQPDSNGNVTVDVNMQLPTVVDSIDQMTDTTKQYILSSDGCVYAYTEVIIPGGLVPNFTNVANTDGTGWTMDTRISTTSTSANDTLCVTNEIKATNGDTIYFKNLDIYVLQTTNMRFGMWKNGVRVNTVDGTTPYYGYRNGYVTVNTSTGVTACKLVDQQSGQPFSSTFDTVRFTVAEITDFSNVIITVNEPIEYVMSEEKITYQWVNTGLQFSTPMPQTVNSIEEMTDITKKYVLSTDGYVYVYREITYGGIRQWVSTGKTLDEYMANGGVEEQLDKLDTRVTKLEKDVANINTGGSTSSGSTIPSYWVSELETKADLIQQAMENAGRNKSAFLWYTDAHWYNNAKQSPMLLKYLCDNTPINKVNFGGDIVADPSPYDHTNNKLVYEWRKLIADIPNHHSVYGNHDLNHWSTDVQELAYALVLAHQETNDMATSEIDSCYYIDCPSEKTRYLYLTYPKSNQVFMETQGIIIVSSLMSTPENWHIIAIAHRWWQYSSSETPTVGSIPAYEKDILSVFDSYNARQSRSGSNYFTAQDFTNAKAKVEFCIGGHIHAEYDFRSDGGIPIIITSSDTNQERHEGDDDCGTVGTITEQAIYGIIADYKNNKINVIGIGRGETRIITL